MREARLGLGASKLAEELREDVRVFREGYEFLAGQVSDPQQKVKPPDKLCKLRRSCL